MSAVAVCATQIDTNHSNSRLSRTEIDLPQILEIDLPQIFYTGAHVGISSTVSGQREGERGRTLAIRHCLSHLQNY